MSKLENIAPENEKEEARNWFNRFLFKIMDFFGLTSGVGIVGVGAYWFIYSLIQYLGITPENIMQQTIHENYFNQAQIGVVILALGILIMEVKKLHAK